MTMMYRLGKAKQSAILFIYVAIVLKWDNQLQNYLRHSPVFWHKWPVHNLVLVTPPPPLHPLSKLLAIHDHTQNLEQQLWMGGRREVSTSVISQRSVTRSDLKQERSFFSWECLNIFATGCSKKNPCYFCGFCDICIWLLPFLSLEFCYICYFCDFCVLCIKVGRGQGDGDIGTRVWGLGDARLGT